MTALDGEAFVLGGIENGPVVGIAVTCGSIVVAVDFTAFDVDLNLRPLVESLGHGFRVGCIYNIVEGVLYAVNDVESLLKLSPCLGIRNELIVDTASEVERSVGGYVAIDEDIERIAVLFGIDASGVAHIRAAAGHHLVVPIVCIAVGFVAVDAEVLLELGPRLVLNLEGCLCHELGHSCFGEGLCEFIVGHGLILGLELCAGRVFEEVAAERYCSLIGVEFAGIGVFQAAKDGAIAVPA